ncbi:MAG: hypothetical protein WC565_08090 [Parcubacteria group bacterium]|jgi:hypothetical protein
MKLDEKEMERDLGVTYEQAIKNTVFGEPIESLTKGKLILVIGWMAKNERIRTQRMGNEVV